MSPVERRASAGFERLPRRGPRPPTVGSASTGPAVGRDAHGKRALYSGVRPVAPGPASLRVECARCGGVRLLGAWQALWTLTPSVHLPVLRPRHASLLRCPACRRVSWVRLGLHRTSTRES
jgi:hypothetical protein